MEYEKFKFWFSVLQWLTTAGVWLYVRNVNRNRVTTDHIARVEREGKADCNKLETQMDARHDNHADRLARLEQNAKHAPSHDDLKHLLQRLDVTIGELRKLSGQFEGANHTLTLIHRHLLESNK